MCVVSMIMDHYYDEWWRRYRNPTLPPVTIPVFPYTPQPLPQPMPTQQELDEFRRLLDRARKYDKDNGEPDCELEQKRQKLKGMAKELGVDISFV